MIQFIFPHYFGFDFYSLCREFWEALGIVLSGRSVNGLSWHSSWAFVCKSECLRSKTTQYDPTCRYWAATEISKYLILWLSLKVLHFLGKSLIWGHKAFFRPVKVVAPMVFFSWIFLGICLCYAEAPYQACPFQTTCLQELLSRQPACKTARGEGHPKTKPRGSSAKIVQLTSPSRNKTNLGNSLVEIEMTYLGKLIPGNFLVEWHVFDPDCSFCWKHLYCFLASLVCMP